MSAQHSLPACALIVAGMLMLAGGPVAAQALPWETPPKAPPAGAIDTPHLTIVPAVSEPPVASGTRRTLGVDIAPKRGIHVYAPGQHAYQVIGLAIDPQPWLRAAPTRYPPSRIYEFVPLNERVEVYSAPFRLERDVTILTTPEARKSLAGRTAATVTGRVEYQACDDKVCYAPRTVPVQWQLELKPPAHQ